MPTKTPQLRLPLITFTLVLTLALCAHARGAQRAPADHAPQPTQKTLGAALVQHLAQSGQLCVGKYTWPIRITSQDVANRQRDAVQLPVMEQAGLVEATPADDGAVSYRLSTAGRRWYWPRLVTPRDGAPGKLAVQDFCAGTLTLDRLVRWTPPVLVGGHYETLATYTYTMQAAEWTTDARLLDVFPVVDQIVKGQRSAELAQRLRFVDGQWVAVTELN
jgi:hypothetical protein